MTVRRAKSPATTWAVMPVYNPSSLVEGRIRSIAAQVDQLVVVDDGSEVSVEGLLKQPLPTNATLVRLALNSGIAAALNRGVKTALAQQAAFILTIDQDTLIPDDYVSVIRAQLLSAQTVDGSVGIAAPGRVNSWSPPIRHEGSWGACSIELIQSGMLFDAVTFRSVGLFDAGLFIDGVELEYALRAHRHGVHVTLASTAISQPLGELTRRKIGPRTVYVELRSGNRAYYIMRNTLSLAAKNLTREPAWTWRRLSWLGRNTLKSLVLGRGRKEVASGTIAGVRDALLRKNGRRHGKTK